MKKVIVLLSVGGLSSMAAVLVAVVAAVATVPAGDAGASGSVAPGSVAGIVGDIPAVYLAAFDAAAERFDVPWSVLAGIYRVECDFGASPLPGCPRGTRNSAGAQGPGQFLPGTWRSSLGPGAMIEPGPPVADGAGYATDGDGDGVADAWDPFDAAASTARMLSADGAPGDVSAAVFGYDHDPAYVATVLSLAAGYERDRAALDAAGSGRSGAAGGSVAVGEVLAFARAQLGLPYQWGGSGPLAWDCSGLVQAAMATAGIQLPHDAAAQYVATSGRPVPLSSLQPGDLVFYGTTPATIHHVGIAVDDGHMIDAPFTGAVVRIDPVAAADLLAATRPLG